jgi:hypothetical protein
MSYRSKKDWWLLALVWAGVSVPFAMGLYLLLSSRGNPQAGWHMMTTGTVVVAVVLLLTYPMQYEITASELIVRSGLMRWKIDLSSIEEAYPTRNPASAPAWSLDRLCLVYRKNTQTSLMLISPEDKAGLMLDIASRVEGLEVEGDRLVRRL